MIVAVLQLQIDPLAEVFDEAGIQLFAGNQGQLKTLGGGCWSNRCAAVAAGVRGEP
jgi:hypothetical protein